VVFLPPENVLEKAYKKIREFTERYIEKYEVVIQNN